MHQTCPFVESEVCIRVGELFSKEVKRTAERIAKELYLFRPIATPLCMDRCRISKGRTSMRYVTNMSSIWSLCASYGNARHLRYRPRESATTGPDFPSTHGHTSASKVQRQVQCRRSATEHGPRICHICWKFRCDQRIGLARICAVVGPSAPPDGLERRWRR